MLRYRMLLIALMVLGFPGAAAAQGIWVLCDHCHDESTFMELALNAPHEGMVFVSNRATGETRKFSRSVRWHWGGNAFVPQVAARALSPTEKAVFDAAIERGNTVVVSLPRNSDSLRQWGLGSAVSVVEDIANGMLSPALLMAIQNHVLLQGYFPTASSLSHSLSLSILGIFTWSGQEVSTSRSTVLNLMMLHDDGSQLFVKFNRTGEIISVSAVDANGQGIGLSFSPSSGVRVDSGLVGSWEFGDQAAQAAQSLGAWISASGPLQCDWEETALNRVRVTCRRQP